MLRIRVAWLNERRELVRDIREDRIVDELSI